VHLDQPALDLCGCCGIDEYLGDHDSMPLCINPAVLEDRDESGRSLWINGLSIVLTMLEIYGQHLLNDESRLQSSGL
jgi:hypothetical protein